MFDEGGDVFFAHLHEFCADGFQFSCGLQEISAVRPQKALVFRHQKSARAPCKTGEELARLEAILNVLAC